MPASKKRRIEAGKTSGRIGVVTRQPPVWAAAAAGMALVAGARGRRAALRGTVAYLIGTALGNGVKPLFYRPQPRHRFPRKPHVVRGAFPSGHAAAEVAATFGAAQELPAAFFLLGSMAFFGHWSLVRARKHFFSDTFVGGMMGIGVSALLARAWPSSGRAEPARADRQLPSHAG